MTRVTEVAKLLPHDGPMVLLDSVEGWSEDEIECHSLSHTKSNNPLRVDGVLSVYAGVEYAAQAMAAHNALNARAAAVGGEAGNTAQKPRQGVVAVASKIEASVLRLDEDPSPLVISVKSLDGTGDSSLYKFEIRQGEALRVAGRLLVMLV